MKQKEPITQTFEQALDELAKIVKSLEDGDMPLEESLELFERGIKLSRDCHDRLAKAERRVELLTKESNGDFALEDLGDDHE